ncbi:MAG: hypothetical protein N2Z81_00470 [Hydrogenothermaceae bacterium]|nr:hypothetical protein [Hydrogenothermaceae bacterium]
MERFVKGDVVVVPFPLKEDDFITGNLNKSSNIRPNKIFTADESIVLYKVGSINEKKIQEVIDVIINILRN